MSARVPGAPSQADAARMRANAQTGVTSMTRKYQWIMPKDHKSASNEFPIVTVPKDPYDDVANIKSQYAQGEQVGTNWVVPFEQSDAAYMMRKRDDMEKAEFDAWIMQKYDITDPAQNLMLQNIAPELFQRREEVIEGNQALVTAYAKTRLRGAKSLSDLELEWLIETGRLELPKGPIWSPKDWRTNQTGSNTVEGDNAWNAQRYRFGLFSPMQWLTKSNAGKQPGANRADIAGSNNPYTPDTVPYTGSGYANYWGLYAPYPSAGGNSAVPLREAGSRDALWQAGAYGNGTDNAYTSTNPGPPPGAGFGG